MVGWMTDELLLYGGTGIAVTGVILFFLYVCISRIAKRNLEKQLEKEYGEKAKN